MSAPNSRLTASSDSSSARKVFQGTTLALYWMDGRAHAEEDAVCGGSTEYELEEAAGNGPNYLCQ
jgi:hypothetical protein